MAPSAFVLPPPAAAAPVVCARGASTTAAGSYWRCGGGGSGGSGGGGSATVAPRLRHAVGRAALARRTRCSGGRPGWTPTASAQGSRRAGPPTTPRPPVILLVLQLEALAAGACPPGSRLNTSGGTSGDPEGSGGGGRSGSGSSSGASGDSGALTELVARLTTHKAAGGRAYVVGATSGPPAEAVRLLEMLAVDAPPRSPPSRRPSRGAGFGPPPARANAPTPPPPPASGTTSGGPTRWLDAALCHDGAELYQSGYRTADPLWEETVSKSGAWAPKPIAWVVSSSFGEQLSPAGSLPPAPPPVSSAAPGASADGSAAPADAARTPSPPPMPARRPPPAAAGEAARNRLAFDIAPSVSDASALAADVSAALASNGLKVRVTVNAGPDGRAQVVCSPAAASVADAVAFVQKMLGVQSSQTLVYGHKPFVVDAVGGKGDRTEPVGLAVVDGRGGAESNETSETIYCSTATGAAAVIEGLLHHAVL